MMCLSELNIDVPALGNFYDPDVKAKGGQVIPSKSSIRKWGVIPNAKKVELEVYNKAEGKSFLVGTVEYKVIPPPKPTIALYINGKEYTGQKISAKAKITIQ